MSGEYLHGEIDRDLFLRNQKAADQGLDLLAHAFLPFKEQFLIADQATQRAATNAVETMLQSVIFAMMRYDAAPEEIEQYELLVRVFSRLTDDGKAEMLKRLKEYLIVDEQKKQASE